MFGKKNEEEWEYIEQYFQKDNYGQVADAEYWHRENTKTDNLIEIFKPHLLYGEQILCVIGGGKGKTVDPLESGKNQRKFMRYRGSVIAVFITIFVLGFLLVFGDSSIFTLLLVLLMCGVPAALVIGVIALIIWGASSGAKGVNYAITDKRIISDGYGQINTLSLKDITSTSASVTSGIKGKLTIVANRCEGKSMTYILVIPNINNPYHVKDIIDQAIEEYKANSLLR